MRTLESRNSSGLIAPGHISKNHQRYSKERHFFFKLSTRRKIEKIQFPWVSYSKFSILAKYASVSYTQICIWYRAILLEDASDASVPLYKYGSILHTVPPYFPMYALCNATHYSRVLLCFLQRSTIEGICAHIEWTQRLHWAQREQYLTKLNTLQFFWCISPLSILSQNWTLCKVLCWRTSPVPGG